MIRTRRQLLWEPTSGYDDVDLLDGLVDFGVYGHDGGSGC